jgi:hypothetical protein
MIKIIAELKLYVGKNKRQTPFTSGYRPAFSILEDTLTSGMINLLDRKEFYPGDQGIVEIKFIHIETNEIERLKTYYFYEGENVFGEIKVLTLSSSE